LTPCQGWWVGGAAMPARMVLHRLCRTCMISGVGTKQLAHRIAAQANGSSPAPNGTSAYMDERNKVSLHAGLGVCNCALAAQWLWCTCQEARCVLVRRAAVEPELLHP